MKLIVNPYRIDVELTERNLRTLLLKLEREDSARTLEIFDEGGRLLSVKAVPDEEHYADREPGEVHGIEEAKLNDSGEWWEGPHYRTHACNSGAHPRSENCGAKVLGGSH